MKQPQDRMLQLDSTGDHPLKIYCIYAPVVHQPDTVHWTKRDSDKQN